MKKRTEKDPKRILPAFSSEAEESEWWFKNRNIHGKQLAVAMKDGEARVLTKEKLRERILSSRKGPSPVVRCVLLRKIWLWLPYQTYIKSLLHETLIERETRKVG